MESDNTSSSGSDDINDNIDRCYICLSSKEPLVYPCKQCHAPVHEDCIQKQIDYDTKCGTCKKNLPLKEQKTLNTQGCYRDIGLLFLSIFFFAYQIVGINLLIVGSGIGNNDFNIESIFSMMLYMPMMFLLQCPPWFHYNLFFWEEDYYNENLKKSVLTIIGIIILEPIVIMFGHGVGYPIVRYMFGYDEFFTWRTSMAGGVVVYAILIFLSIIWCIKKGIIDRNTTVEKVVVDV